MNKKIRNATVTKKGSIIFKSMLEKTIYNCLLEHGFEPEYEPTTFTLINGFTARTPFYDKETDNQFKKRRESGDRTPRRLVRKSGVMQGIRYTPDFHSKYNGIDIYIEAKGIENDVFYIKKKLFLRYLDMQESNSLYFEVYTKKQLLQAIEIIKSYEPATLHNTKIN